MPDRSGSSPAQSRSNVVLPAPFGPVQQHDLAGLDVEIGAGERGEPAEQANGRPKADDAAGTHGPPSEREGAVPRKSTKGAR